MNERGFFTLIGICFLLVAAIFVRGLQESEGNYYNVTRNFHDEVELQNAADSALIKAVEITDFSAQIDNPILNETWEKIHVEVYAEENIFELYERTYRASGIDDTKIYSGKRGVTLLSVASRDNDKMTGKIYRRSLGYFLTEDKHLQFMKSLNNN